MTNINTFQGDVFIHEYIKHTGDDNNLFGFSGTDTFKIATAGSDRLTVGSDGAVTVANDLFVSEYIKHTGDDNTYIRFTGDTVAMYAGGSHKIDVGASNTKFYSDIYISQYIYHYSDNNTYFGFPNNDHYVVRTSGVDAFSIDSSRQSTFSGVMYVNTSQYVNGTSYTPHIQRNSGSFSLGSYYNYSTEIRAGGNIMFTVDGTQYHRMQANRFGVGTASPLANTLTNQLAYKARNNSYTWSFGVGSHEFYIYGGNNGVTGVYMPWNGASWVPHSSDSRTKKNFTPIENSLEKLRNIRPVLFHYLFEEDTDEKRLGFIAQDWLAQQPECVYHNESAGNLTMSLTETIPVLCAGIKELDSNQQVIQEVVNNLSDFTGQHRCLMKDISPNDYPKYEGLVVSANNNEYLNHDSITKPTINEALPIVSLTNKEKDKTCLGVISLKVDPESHLPDDPTRLKINALGEGGIWTININGSLESGDYITSSNIAGYGMRQDDDIIHNYTIAKITQDCDFTKKMRKIKTLVKELKDITYYKFTYKVNITKDEYDVTDESLRLEEEYDCYHRKEIHEMDEISPGMYESDAYQRIGDIQTVSKEEYDQNQLLYNKKTQYKHKDSGEIILTIDIYEENPEEYDVEIIYTTKSIHIIKEEYDKNPSLYNVVKRKIKEYKCDKDKFDEMIDGDGMKHEFKLVKMMKYSKLEKRETTEPHPGYETEVRRELVNVLDENGQLTWNESEETETEYDLRYLTSNGSQTDEANTVHIAAFVGCTYHCG